MARARVREYQIKFSEQGGDSLQRQSKRIDGSLAGLKSSAKALGGALAAAFTVKQIFDFGNASVKVAAQFEALQTRLNNMFGSVERGQQAFDTFNKIASTTPFELRNVVEAGATLKAFGVDAEKNLKTLADLAAFMGVDIVEAAGAMGRAFSGGAGAADVFRDRGILNIIKLKQGITDFTKVTIADFRKAMFDTFADPTTGIPGATDKLSKTISGMESNAADAFTQLQNRVGLVFAPSYRKALKLAIDTTNALTDAMKGAAEKAKDFKEFRLTTEATFANIDKLKERYLTLSRQTERSEEDQRELNTVIAAIEEIVPGAIEGIRGYGSELSVNIGVLEAFVDAQKELLKRTERDVFEGLKKSLAGSASEAAEAQSVLAALQKTIVSLSTQEGEPFKAFKELRARVAAIPPVGTSAASTMLTLQQELSRVRREADEAAKDLRTLEAAIKGDVLALSQFESLKTDEDLEDLRSTLNLSAEAFKNLLPAINQVRKAQEGAGKGAEENQKKTQNLTTAQAKQLKNLQLQEQLLKIATQRGADVTRLTIKDFQDRTKIVEGETTKQIKAIEARFAAEIKRAGKASELVVQLERVKALEILKINQAFDDDIEQRARVSTAGTLEHTEEFVAEMSRIMEGIATPILEPLEVPKPGNDEFRAWDKLSSRAEGFSRVFETAILDQWREGKGLIRSLADVFIAEISRMAAAVAARAAVFGILNFATGGTFGVQSGGLGNFILQGLGFGGAPRIAPTPQLSTDLPVNLPPPARPAEQTQVVNVQINAVDAESFRDFMRRGGAEITVNAISDLV